MLVGATNPCACGYNGDPKQQCKCSHASLQRHSTRLNGPLLDRIDLILHVESASRKDLMSNGKTEGSAEIRARVIDARRCQAERLSGSGACCNAEMSVSQLEHFCDLDRDADTALKDAYRRVALTGRGHFRLLRVARTLADLAGRERVERQDITEAVAYRSN